MLKSDEKVIVSKELVQQFEEINRALNKHCDFDLQQPNPNKQIALLTDAVFGAAGYAVLIEDYPNQKFTSILKSYAPVTYGSKTFIPAQIKMSTDKDVHLSKRISCDIFLIQKNRACFLGRAETGHNPNRQRSRDQTFPNEICTFSPV